MFVILYSETVLAQGDIRSGGRDINAVDKPRTTERKATGGSSTIYRDQMRNLVIKISRFVRKVDKNFIVLTRGGLELIEKTMNAGEETRRSAATTYIKAIDGVVLTNLFFRPPVDGGNTFETDPEIREPNLRLARLGQKRGLTIWVTDFAPDTNIAEQSHKMNMANGFIPFTANNVDGIFNRVHHHHMRTAHMMLIDNDQ